MLLITGCGSSPTPIRTGTADSLSEARIKAWQGHRADAHLAFREMTRDQPHLVESWAGAVETLSPDDTPQREGLSREIDAQIAALGTDGERTPPLRTLRAELIPDLSARERDLYAILNEHSSSWPRAALGSVFAARGNHRAALRFFEEAADRDPGLARAWRGVADMRIATGDSSGSIHPYERYLRLRPHDPHALYNLALILARRQRPRDALPYLQRALQVIPTDVDTLTNLGSVALLLKEPDVRQAEECFLTALEQAPDDPDIHYNLGILYADHRDNPAQAIHHFERCLELRGGSRARLQKWIDELRKKNAP